MLILVRNVFSKWDLIFSGFCANVVFEYLDMRMIHRKILANKYAAISQFFRFDLFDDDTVLWFTQCLRANVRFVKIQ
jgi:hypothetical protein